MKVLHQHQQQQIVVAKGLANIEFCSFKTGAVLNTKLPKEATAFLPIGIGGWF